MARRHGPSPTAPTRRIGLISDTHGLLRPEAVEFLRDCDFIIHAGDIGGTRAGSLSADALLEALGRLAPVVAVRGNNDGGKLAQRLRDTEFIDCATVFVDCATVRLCVIHDLAGLALDSRTQRPDVVVAGHSHRPRVEERAGVLFVNPGSAGPRRFSLPVCIGIVTIAGARIAAQVFTLAAGGWLPTAHAGAIQPAISPLPS